MKTTGEQTKDAPTTAPAKTDTIGSLIERMKPEIAKAAPSILDPQRLARVFLTEIRKTPKLAQCSQASLLGSLMTMAQVGLEPGSTMGLCYLIPYGNEATFQLGYKGLIELAHRSGQYQRISAEVVYANDHLDYEKGTNPHLVHKDWWRVGAAERGEPIAYYAQYKLTNGGEHFVIWPKADVESHAKKYSKGFAKSDSAWQTAFDQMAKKTVLIDLLRYAPKSVEMAKAASYDDHVVRFDEANAELDAVIGEYEEVAE